MKYREVVQFFYLLGWYQRVWPSLSFSTKSQMHHFSLLRQPLFAARPHKSKNIGYSGSLHGVYVQIPTWPPSWPAPPSAWRALLGSFEPRQRLSAPHPEHMTVSDMRIWKLFIAGNDITCLLTLNWPLKKEAWFSSLDHDFINPANSRL